MPESFVVELQGADAQLSPDRVERELSAMWKPINEAQGAAVARMVLSNIVWLGRARDVERVQKILQRVVPRHPSRVFLLEYREEETSPTLQVALKAQCFRPRSGDAPVCCELIHFTFGPAAARHVRGSVAPLLLGDIPTVLWLGLADESFPKLAELQKLADRTITMDMRAPSPAAHLRRCLADAGPTFDLCWFRMLPLREQIAASFDDPANPFALDRVTAVRLAITRNGPFRDLPLFEGALLTGWLGSRLGWTPAQGNIRGYRFQSPRGLVNVTVEERDERADAAHTGLLELAMTDAEGCEFRAALAPQAGSLTLSFQPAGGAAVERQLPFSELSGWQSLGNALNVPPRLEDFRAAATLAIPMLEHFGA
jgi:glucose-6-phosphate dehydrogenase assembly protein OpcA